MKKFYKKALIYLVAAVLISPASLANGVLKATYAKASYNEGPCEEIRISNESENLKPDDGLLEKKTIPSIQIKLDPDLRISNDSYSITIDHPGVDKVLYQVLRNQTDSGWIEYTDTPIIVEGQGRYTVTARGTEEFEDIMDAVHFRIDTTPPRVYGLEDGAHYNRPVTPQFSRRAIVTLNGKKIDSGKLVSEDGEYTLVATDRAGNSRTIHFFIDKIAPVIKLNGESEITIEQGSAFIDPDAIANDNIEGDLSSKIKKNSNLDINIIGDYTITYDVEDAAGNKADQVVRNVHVVASIIIPAPDFIATGITNNNQNAVKVEWEGVGGGVDGYDIYVDGVWIFEPAQLVGDEGVKYSRTIDINKYGVLNVLVVSRKGTQKSTNNTYKTVEFKEPAKAEASTPPISVSLTSATTVPTPAPVSVAPERVKALEPQPVEQKIETGDEDGKIKSEETSDETEKINWTPWIVLFVLIILAGAATGGYFYWFNGEEEVKSVVREPKEDKKAKIQTKVSKKSGSGKKPKRW